MEGHKLLLSVLGFAFPVLRTPSLSQLCRASASYMQNFVMKSHKYGILKATCKSRKALRLWELVSRSEDAVSQALQFHKVDM
jgi:hypothetical protein